MSDWVRGTLYYYYDVDEYNAIIAALPDLAGSFQEDGGYFYIDSSLVPSNLEDTVDPDGTWIENHDDDFGASHYFYGYSTQWTGGR